MWNRMGMRMSVLWLTMACTAAWTENDVVIADFERPDYGAWTATGEAFGNGPAKGTLPGQMDVSGFRGERLVNSFLKGDGTTGTLTSPPFTIQRRFISFLIGGGKYPGETCINLCIGGKVVRTETGPNDKPGGSERLHWKSWDVAEFAGQQARIEIVDKATGSWGHINVDQILQSDEAAGGETKRELRVEHPVLNVPIKNGAPKTMLRLKQGETLLREFEVELASGDPDFWCALDLKPFQGQTLTLSATDLDSRTGFDAIVQADRLQGGDNLYQEQYRPQFHFSAARGWNNDPNGLVYYKGEYHLFFQHNPVGWNWGNMTWGHAVSLDLVHWTELGDVIYPDALGTVFSGSAVIDDQNTTGFQTGTEKPLVCVYTCAGGTSPWAEGKPFTQALAYSNDGGRTFTKYEGNPVQGHINGGNRDPKAFWYAPGECWVIVLYLDDKRMGFFTSPDLKHWTMQSELKSFHECPELFTLPVDGKQSDTRWVLYGASGEYMTGAFDGKQFTPDSPVLPFNRGNCFYASQTYNNIPKEDGRRIQIGWGTIGDKSMPFNQMMDFPVVLSLRTADGGVRMCAWPVREIESLYAKQHEWKRLKAGTESLEKLTVDAVDIEGVFKPGTAKKVGFTVRGIPVEYDTASETLSCLDKHVRVAPHKGRLALRLLVDRQSIEIFAQDGEVYMPMGMHFEDANRKLGVVLAGGGQLETLCVRELRSAWNR